VVVRLFALESWGLVPAGDVIRKENKESFFEMVMSDFDGSVGGVLQL